MNKMITAVGLAALLAAASAAPVAAQRQQEKNTMRNLGIGLGAAAAHQLIRGRTTNAIVLGAGAAYAGKKYEDARKAQRRESVQIASGAPINVIVNDNRIGFRDTRPMMINNRVYVPMRGVLEEMGADVQWDEGQSAVIARQNGREVRLPADGPARVDGRAVELEAPAYIIDGRTMVPLRFMAETFGADVNWVADSREVHIRSDVS